MSWRGQGGRRAKGRRGDQDPELDNTAWLAELEREAAQADDEEDDWASTLRSRRSPGPAAAAPPPPPAPDPGWAPPDRPPPDPGWSPPAPAPPGHRFPDAEAPASGADLWADSPSPHDPPADRPAPDPDWSWRPAPDAYGEPPREPFGEHRNGTEPGAGWDRPRAVPADWGSPAAQADDGWQPGGADAATGAWSPPDPSAYGAGEADYPVGREPDYPALFGELYRRSAAQQDPIWEAPPAAEPLPEAAQPEASSQAWPFEETTQSWEPSDRSFIWPPDELPSAPAEWEQPPGPAPWLDDPTPAPPLDRTAAPPPPSPPLDHTAAWPAPDPGPLHPPPAAPVAQGPPPADWAAAIPTDLPAASRAADPAAATRMWRADVAEAEPGVPLAAAPEEEPAEVRRKAPPRRNRPAGERQARSWPRIVAILSWIVLVMVVCWFYVFPWLERVLPESF